jgi:dTDP-glucose 4,6-dehydratase
VPPLDVADLDHVLLHTGDLWAPLRGARLLLTGGTGFFGVWLLESLLHANRTLDLGIEAWVVTRSAERFGARAPHLAAAPAVRIVEGDVRAFAFPPGRFAAVVHAAAESGSRLAQEAPGEMLDVLVEGTRRTLAFARESGAHRFLLVSSGAVYGPQPPSLARLEEGFGGGPEPTDARSAYAEGKRVAELLGVLAARERGLGVAIARGFAFVGPGLPLDAHFAIGNFIRDGLAGGPIRVTGDGTPRRSYLYAADLAIWLWTILLRGAAGRAYNVGSSEDYAIAAVAQLVAAAFTPPPEVTVAAAADPGAAAARYVPSVRRAADELGLEARIVLPDAIRRTLGWHVAARPAAGRMLSSRGSPS